MSEATVTSDTPVDEATARLYYLGKPLAHAVEVHEHVSPMRHYVAVLLALFVLTGLTYAVSYADLGAASLPVAMIVAVIKASLVCAYFMHLRYDNGFHVFVFVSTLLFVAIFFTLTLFDLSTRTRLNEQQGTFFRRHDGGWSDELYVVTPEGAAADGAHGAGDAPPATEHGEAEPAAGH